MRGSRFILGLLALIAFTILLTGCIERTVSTGNFVNVAYVGTYRSNGTVFDSTGPVDVSGDPLNSENRAPLDQLPGEWVYVGDGAFPRDRSPVHPNDVRQKMPAFWQALLGHREGDAFRVELTPEEAFGLDDPTKIKTVSRIVSRSRIVHNLTAEQLLEESDLDPNATDNPPFTWRGWNAPITARILEIDRETDPYTYDIILSPENGTELYLGHWNGTVVDVNDADIMIRQDPTIEQTYLDDDGAFRVVSLTDESMVLDYNDPMRGEWIVYDIRVLEIRSPLPSEEPEAEGRPNPPPSGARCTAEQRASEQRYWETTIQLRQGFSDSVNRLRDSLRSYVNGYQSEAQTLDDISVEHEVAGRLADTWFDNDVPFDHYKDMDTKLGSALLNYETALELFWDGLYYGIDRDIDAANNHLETAIEKMKGFSSMIQSKPYCAA